MNRLLEALRNLGLLGGVLGVLRKVGLLKVVFTAYQQAIALQFHLSNGQRGPEQANGLPLPPADMIVLVAGIPDRSAFLQHGAWMFHIVVDTLREHGVEPESLSAILDFGCGCGRVLRYWGSIKGPRIYGVDYNPRLVEWCRENLSFASCAATRLYPPLPYEDGMFDCVYAMSVFTHMSGEFQSLWMQELRRVIRPGGYLLITTHGGSFGERLTASEREVFVAGRLVVRYQEASGMNLCTAYHPESYVRHGLSVGFSVQDFLPATTRDGLFQDLYLLKKI